MYLCVVCLKVCLCQLFRWVVIYVFSYVSISSCILQFFIMYVCMYVCLPLVIYVPLVILLCSMYVVLQLWISFVRYFLDECISLGFIQFVRLYISLMSSFVLGLCMPFVSYVFIALCRQFSMCSSGLELLSFRQVYLQLFLQFVRQLWLQFVRYFFVSFVISLWFVLFLAFVIVFALVRQFVIGSIRLVLKLCIPYVFRYVCIALLISVARQVVMSFVSVFFWPLFLSCVIEFLCSFLYVCLSLFLSFVTSLCTSLVRSSFLSLVMYLASSGVLSLCIIYVCVGVFLCVCMYVGFLYFFS